MEQTNNQEPDTDYLYECERDRQLEADTSLFTTDQKVLSVNSWNLLLRKSPTLTALEEYKQRQKEILRSVFKDFKRYKN